MHPLLALLAELESDLPAGPPPAPADAIAAWVAQRTFAELDQATDAIQLRLRAGRWPETVREAGVAAELGLRLRFATQLATTLLQDPDLPTAKQAEELLCSAWLLTGLAWSRYYYRP